MFGVLDPLVARMGVAFGSVDCDWWLQINGWDPVIPVQIIIRTPGVERKVFDRRLTKYNITHSHLEEWQASEDACIRHVEDIIRELKQAVTEAW